MAEFKAVRAVTQPSGVGFHAAKARLAQMGARHFVRELVAGDRALKPSPKR